MRFSSLNSLLLIAGVALCNTLGAQNVGVGIATPAAKLEVDGGFAVTPVAVPAGAAITVPVNETVIRITNDGANVAIGVAAPASATEGQFLSIRNEDATNTATFAGTAIPAGQMAEFIFLNGGWRFRTGTAGTDWTLAGNAGTGTEVLGTTNAQPLRIITNNTERVRVDANGNVGIGTTLPNAALQLGNVIANRRIVLWEDVNNDHQFYGMGINNATLRFQISDVVRQFTFNAATGAAASNELMRIQGNGNVGIGTAAPTATLHTNGNISLEPGIAGGMPNRVIGQMTPVAANHGELRVQAGSAVFSGGTNWGGNLVLAGGDYNSGLAGTNWGGNVILRAGRNMFTGAQDAANIYMQTNSSGAAGTWVDRMTIISRTGFVGIGTVTPSALLDVAGEIQIASTGATAAAVGAGGLRWDGTNIQYSNGAAWVNMLNGNTGWQLAGNAGTGAELLGTTNAQPLRVITNNAERMRVDANGLVGIGLINPGARLTIRNNGTDPGAFDDGKALFVSGAYNSGTAYDGGVEFRHDNLTQGIGFGFNTIYATGSNANQELNIISRGSSHITMQAYGGVTGNVGIGVVAPTAKLEVYGGTFNARLGIGTGWNGATYPTLSGTSAEQWIMIHNPHIPYLQNGVNGYVGATTGAQVRMAANTAAGTYWDAGILATLGSDAYGISRAGGGAMLSVFNNGNVGIGTTTLANTPSRLYIASGNAPAIGLDNASQLWARNNATVLEPFMWPRWVDNVMYMNFGAGGFRLRNNASADAIAIDANNRIGMNIGVAQQYRLNVYDVQLTGNGDGQHTVYGYRTRDSQNDGTGYIGIFGTNSASCGYNFWGDVYTFGMHGHTWGDYTRTGGVLGSTLSTGVWGSIGYKASNSVGYGVYGSTGYANGGGYSPADAQQSVGIGIGAYGGVMGGWVRGDVMGFATAGEVYASYNLGNEYTSGHSADIVTTADGQRHAAFANTSTSLKVYADGSSTLEAGTVYVAFDADFRALVAAGTRPTVTVTPIGECNGLHIVSIDANGFTVRENGGGAHNVEFTWIAIGKRIDAPANNALPGVVARPDFDDQMRGVMFNENNHEQSATPVWYDGQGVRFDEVPASLLGPIKATGAQSPDDIRHQESQRQQGPTAPAPQR